MSLLSVLINLMYPSYIKVLISFKKLSLTGSRFESMYMVNECKMQ